MSAPLSTLAEWLTAWFADHMTIGNFTNMDDDVWAAALISDLGEKGWLRPPSGCTLRPGESACSECDHDEPRTPCPAGFPHAFRKALDDE